MKNPIEKTSVPDRRSRGRRVLLLLALAVGPFAHAQDTTTFEASSFGDWTFEGVYSSPVDGATGSLEARSGDGNPGDYSRIVIQMPPNPGCPIGSYAVAVKPTAVYDPRVSGAIDSIDHSWDMRPSPDEGGGNATSLALVQDGFLYAAFDARLLSTGVTEWTRFSINGLTAADFGTYAPWRQDGQPANPDFSETGSAITFGHLAGTSRGYSAFDGLCADPPAVGIDLDNWEVVVRSAAVTADPTVYFEPDKYVVSEAAGSVTATVTRGGDSTGAVTVDFATADQTAVAGTDRTDGDYRATSGTLSFDAGETSQSIEVEIFDDEGVEGLDDETFLIGLSNPTGGATVADGGGTATVFIQDDESLAPLTLRLIIDDLNEDDLDETDPQIPEDVTDSGTIADLGTVGELDEQFAVYALVDNDDPGLREITDATIVFRLEKTALAGYEVSSDCVADADSDAQAVIVTCDNLTFPAMQANNAVPGLPGGAAPAVALFVGYAGTTSDGNTYEYSAEITAAVPAAAIPDPAAVTELLTITNPDLPPGLIANDGDGLLDCFIATAAYGSAWEPNVELLRSFRDRYLITNAPGRWFVTTYYRLSPPIAAWIAEREWARALTRGALTPLITAIRYPAESGLALLMASGLLVGWRRSRGRVTAGRA